MATNGEYNSIDNNNENNEILDKDKEDLNISIVRKEDDNEDLEKVILNKDDLFNNLIFKYLFFTYIVLFSINILCYIPLILIYKFIDEKADYAKFWYIGLVGIICIILLSI